MTEAAPPSGTTSGDGDGGVTAATRRDAGVTGGVTLSPSPTDAAQSTEPDAPGTVEPQDNPGQSSDPPTGTPPPGTPPPADTDDPEPPSGSPEPTEPPPGSTPTPEPEDAGFADAGLPAVIVAVPSDGKYRFELGDVVFEIDPAQGARIVTFSHRGTNVLLPLTSAAGFLNGGSTFWTSPQADWVWPPVAALDAEPYAVSQVGSLLALESAVASFGGRDISVIKQLMASGAAQRIDIEYTLANRGGVSVALGPWEVSRVAVGGLSFWPDAGGVFGDFEPLLATGHRWVDYASSWPGFPVKTFADASGSWLAHLDGQLLFVKAWPDVPLNEQAPGEAEIEIYLDQTYVEVEQQGPYATINVGETMRWDVRWYLRRVPEGLDTAPGSPALIDYVQGVLSDSL